MHHQLRRWQVLSVVAAMFIVALTTPRDAVAANCAHAAHTPALSGGSVTPGTGTTTTSFRFSVTYKDTAGCPPTQIVVVVAGVQYALAYVSGTSFTGAIYRRSMSLPAGTWAYHFEATSGSASATPMGGSPPTVVVAAPTPTPSPTPVPTPKPTPTPRPTPAPTPTPRPTPRPTPKPTAKPLATARPTASRGPAASPTSTGAAVGTPGTSGTGGSGGTDGQPTPPGDVAVVVPGGPSSSPGVLAPTVGGGPGGLGLNIGEIPRPLLALIVAAAGTAGGLWLFLVFGGRLMDPAIGARSALAFAARRARRIAAPAVGPAVSGAVAAATVTPVAPDAEPVGLVATTYEDLPDPEHPAHVWGGPIAGGALAFTEPPAPGVERCSVVSRLVAVRAEPDEISRPNAERLDVGDEVDVLRLEGPYCFIRTPSGNEGWVPGLALTAVKAPSGGSSDGG